MTRRTRRDSPGALHHVMNRGIAKRPLFDRGRDVRDFLACLARSVRRGEIEVHAFVVLTTHFHLLVRSTDGRLSYALKRIQNDYVRRYNRRRGRDGPLVRGRFRSKLVDSDPYWMAVLRYIDANPVSAGVVPAEGTYLFGSRRHYLRRRGPPWLARDRVERTIRAYSGGGLYEPIDYARLIPVACAPHLATFVENRILRGDRAGDDPADSLSPVGPRQRAWLERKARQADGTSWGNSLLPPSLLCEVVGRLAATGPAPSPPLPRSVSRGWDALRIGLLSSACGESQVGIARRLGMPRTTVREWLQRHRTQVAADAAYGRRCDEVIGLVKDRLLADASPARSLPRTSAAPGDAAGSSSL